MFEQFQKSAAVIAKLNESEDNCFDGSVTSEAQTSRIRSPTMSQQSEDFSPQEMKDKLDEIIYLLSNTTSDRDGTYASKLARFRDAAPRDPEEARIHAELLNTASIIKNADYVQGLHDAYLTTRAAYVSLNEHRLSLLNERMTKELVTLNSSQKILLDTLSKISHDVTPIKRQIQTQSVEETLNHAAHTSYFTPSAPDITLTNDSLTSAFVIIHHDKKIPVSLALAAYFLIRIGEDLPVGADCDYIVSSYSKTAQHHHRSPFSLLLNIASDGLYDRHERLFAEADIESLFLINYLDYIVHDPNQILILEQNMPEIAHKLVPLKDSLTHIVDEINRGKLF